MSKHSDWTVHHHFLFLFHLYLLLPFSTRSYSEVIVSLFNRTEDGVKSSDIQNIHTYRRNRQWHRLATLTNGWQLVAKDRLQIRSFWKSLEVTCMNVTMWVNWSTCLLWNKSFPSCLLSAALRHGLRHVSVQRNPVESGERLRRWTFKRKRKKKKGKSGERTLVN